VESMFWRTMRITLVVLSVILFVLWGVMFVSDLHNSIVFYKGVCFFQYNRAVSQSFLNLFESILFIFVAILLYKGIEQN